uniref:Uncharacterized protein n=1 Tax=Chlamydomonas euryale TaxID=1486919 RepID=A0A7R9VA45_9CHLO
MRHSAATTSSRCGLRERSGASPAPGRQPSSAADSSAQLAAPHTFPSASGATSVCGSESGARGGNSNRSSVAEAHGAVSHESMLDERTVGAPSRPARWLGCSRAALGAALPPAAGSAASSECRAEPADQAYRSPMAHGSDATGAGVASAAGEQ